MAVYKTMSLSECARADALKNYGKEAEQDCIRKQRERNQRKNRKFRK